MHHHQVIEHLIVANRMHHSLTEATKLLLKAALEEPLNSRFVLLSETHVPLYPPGLVYLQLQTEQVSRMDGCHFWPLRIKVVLVVCTHPRRGKLPCHPSTTPFFNNQQDSLDRWRPGMCRRKHWRKTYQWFSATRPHAELIANEEEINNGFRELCHPHINLKLRRFVSCSDNEHYPPVVLAAHDLGHETTCWPGGTTYVDWRRPDKEGRPRSFDAQDVSESLFQRARRSQCDFSQCSPTCATDEQVTAAVESAGRAFVHVLSMHECCQSLSQYAPLNDRCPLFMRKFKPSAEPQLMQVLPPLITRPPPPPPPNTLVAWLRGKQQ